MKNRSYTLNDYLKEEYGSKIYKVSLDGGFTCPNRDGTKGTGGCIFCSENGSGAYRSSGSMSIYDQIEDQLKLIHDKFPKGKVIAYFQNFTNTYSSVEKLKQLFDEALSHPRVMGLAIATRPDCLPDDIIDLLGSYNQKTFLWVELGLQTINEQVANVINRCYPLKDYLEATDKLNRSHIKFVTHIIIGLPQEKKKDPLDSAIFACQHGTWGIKIHLMYINRNTILEKMFQEGKYTPLNKETYIERAVEILRNIPKYIVIHRITGDPYKEELVSPKWCLNKKDVLNSFSKYMADNNFYQGDMYINKNI